MGMFRDRFQIVCIAACCSVLQRVAVGCGVLRWAAVLNGMFRDTFQIVLQCVAACCGGLQCVAVGCSAKRYVS